LALAAPYVKEDFLLVESNQVFEEAAVTEVLGSSCDNGMLVTVPSGSRDEAYVELAKDGTIFRISKDIRQMNHIDGEAVGISKMTHDLSIQMLAYFQTNTNPIHNYEYVLERIGRPHAMTGIRVNDLVYPVIEADRH